MASWGYNNYGQTNVPAGNDFVAIAAGEYHNLALKSDGSLVGWGMNIYDFPIVGNLGWGQRTVLKDAS